MRFIVRYIGTGEPYYCTVYADTIQEAMTLARRYERKGYQYHTITSALQ